MQKGLVLFAAICIAASWVFGLAAFALQDKMGQLAGLVMLPLLFVPLIAAYIGHKSTGAVGNPFKGLVWGPTGMIFGVWLLGLLVGYAAVFVSIGLGIQQLDLSLGSYFEMAAEQAAQQGRGEIGASAYPMLRLVGLSVAIGTPLVGAWVFGAFACVSLFPWLGWFTRRLLVHGKLMAGLILAAAYVMTTLPTGLIQNQQIGEMDITQRMILITVSALVTIPLTLWLFFKTRSVVIPAIAQASIQSALAGAVPLVTQGNHFICPPSGLIAQAVILGAGIALWVWKDPGGEDLAVADVAFDGTPLTPEMVKALEAEEAVHGAVVTAPAETAPAPETPPEADSDGNQEQP